VRERINMTQDSNGRLEASAEERVKLLQQAEAYIFADPVFGNGYATYGLTAHVDGLRDTHDWYLKVMVETGIIGVALTFFMLQQLLATGYRLFKTASDPLYRGLGLGLLLATVSSMIANCFGDRWTYLEITGMLWVLAGAAVCATQFSQEEPSQLTAGSEHTEVAVNPYMVYR
jgi:putative inorganic carbon (HCO3(-)) transporter